MPRPPTISYDDFRAAALALMDAGQAPTFSLLRAKLGGGSYDVLRRYLDAFEREKAARLKTPAMPDDVLGGIQGWYERIREEASTQARAELNAEFELLAQQRAEFEAERARLRDAARDAQRDLARVEADRAVLDAQLGQARDAHARTLGELAATREELAVERERGRQQREQVDHLRAEVTQAGAAAAAGIALADGRARSLERTLLQRHDEAAELWKARLRELEAALRLVLEQQARESAQQATSAERAEAARAAERVLQEQALAAIKSRQVALEEQLQFRCCELEEEREARRKVETEWLLARDALAESRIQAEQFGDLRTGIELLTRMLMKSVDGKQQLVTDGPRQGAVQAGPASPIAATSPSTGNG